MEKENELHFSSSFDIELFFDHVYNAAYDIFEDSFDTFEENVPLLLGNINEGNVNAIAVGFNSIFNTIQEKLEKNLNRWEEYSRANCFINTKEAAQFAEKPSLLESDADSALQRQEESVDAELEFVRSQLHAAGKESARLRRELRSLERILAVKQKREAALHDAASHLESSDQHDMLEELVKVGGLLVEKLKKVKPERLQSPRGVRWTRDGQTDVETTSLESTARLLAL